MQANVTVVAILFVTSPGAHWATARGTGIHKLGRVQDRGVLFPRPCLWLRDFLIAVLSGQVTLLPRAALLAGIT